MEQDIWAVFFLSQHFSGARVEAEPSWELSWKTTKGLQHISGARVAAESEHISRTRVVVELQHFSGARVVVEALVMMLVLTFFAS